MHEKTTDDLFEEASSLTNISEKAEIKARIEIEEHMHNVTVCELLRQHLNDSLEWPLMLQLEVRMNIGEHCGVRGIKTSSITCERPEFERRKEAMEL